MNTKIKSFLYPAIVIILFILLPVVYFIVVTHFYTDMPSSGQFGDTFGGLNALFSVFAFLGIIYTIQIQRKDLNLQREELTLTREELKRTAEAQEKSERALSKQAESLKITAKLNGLGAVLEHYNTLIDLTNSAKYGIDLDQYHLHKTKADKIIEEIEGLIDKK